MCHVAQRALKGDHDGVGGHDAIWEMYAQKCRRKFKNFEIEPTHSWQRVELPTN